jgi:aspartate racemase
VSAPGKDVIGVLGGLGPLASAEFLKTIYEASLGGREQEAPIVVLHSDPTFPDRTEALLAGQEAPLLARLEQALIALRAHGATRMVICCLTMHRLVPSLPDQLRAEVVSLVELTLRELAARGRPHLMLCTVGTRKTRVFESHPAWGAAERFVVSLDEADQEALHEAIYVLKRNTGFAQAAQLVERFAAKYRTSGFVAGCTEMHLLSKFMRGRTGEWLDPLALVAARIAEGTL